MKYILISLIILLQGCATFGEPYWKLVRVPLKYDTTIYYKDEYSLSAVCKVEMRRNVVLHACTERNETNGTYKIHAGPTYDACIERHEHAHGAGWVHDSRVPFVKDCGPDEF